MMRCPSNDSKGKLVVENILYQIATGGGIREPVGLIDPNNLMNGIIQFDHNKPSNEARSNIQCLLDFKKDTFYQGQANQNAFIIIGLPPFMKVKLTSYKLIAPPKLPDRTVEGSLKGWDLFGANSWEEIQSGNSFRIHSVTDDRNLQRASSEHVYNVDLKDDKYFRYFKLLITAKNYQNNLEISLSGIDLSGNIIICRE